MLKVTVNWDLCEGYGVCSGEAPSVFENVDEDQVTLLATEPPEDQRVKVEAAARFCPKNAITVKG